MDTPTLDELLQDTVLPLGSYVDATPDRLRIRTGTPQPVSFRLMPLGILLGGLVFVSGTGLCFNLGVPEPYFSAAIAGLLVAPFAGAGVGVLSNLLITEEQNQTARMVELSAHKVVFKGQHGRVVDEWRVHELTDIWASQDWLSPTIAVKRGSGLSAVRMPDLATAYWMREVLITWHAERFTEPDEEQLEAVAALYAGAKRETTR